VGETMSASPERNVLRNAASSWVRDATEAVLFLILTPFLISVLGPDQYGLWSLVWAVVSLLMLIDMGFGASVVKFIADARGRDDGEAHQRAVGTFFWIYVGQMAVLLALVAIFSSSFGQIFSLSPRDGEAARLAFLILGVGAAVGLPLGMFRGVFLGHQQQRIANYYKLAGSVLYFAAAIAFLSRFPDVTVLALVNALAAFLPLAAIVIHAQRKLQHVSLHPRHFARGELRHMWSFSIWFMLIHVSTIVAARVDTLVISWALDLDAIAIYALAMRLSEKAAQVTLQLSRTLVPVVAELHGAGEEERLRQVWLKGSKLTTAFAAPLLVGLAILAEPLIVTWTDERFVLSGRVLQILAASVLVIVIHANSQNSLGMRGKHRALALTLVSGQVLNLGLSVAVVQRYGLVGVASATLLSSLIASAAVQRQAQRIYGAGFLTFYRAVLLPSVLPTLLMAAAMVGYQWVRPIGSLWEVAAMELVGVGLFWAVMWRTGLDGDEREAVRSRLERLRRR